MDLLSMLSGAMTNTDALSALTDKTGASADQLTKLVNGALPQLISSMTQNASTEEGAQSLLNALTQHTGTETMAQQIADVDAEDGAKIIGHILGDNQKDVVSSLVKETGMETEQVTRGLGSLAPALLSGLSAATGSAAKVDLSDGIDLSDLMAMFGGASKPQASSGLLGGLLGGGSSNQSQSSGGLGSILGGLMGGGQSQTQAQSQSSGGLGSILGGLMGGSSAQTSSQSNGMDLLNILTSFMK